MKLYETVNEGNWLKGGLWDGDKRYCLVGHAMCVYSDYLVQFEELHGAVKALYPERHRKDALSYFNDHPDTTVEDVIRVCKVADV